MSTAMDVAYLDLPYVEHVGHRELLLRVCVPCWEDFCHGCWRGACICACVDDLPVRALPVTATRRCRTCGYLIRSASHKAACATVMERITRLADSIGGHR